MTRITRFEEYQMEWKKAMAEVGVQGEKTEMSPSQYCEYYSGVPYENEPDERGYYHPKVTRPKKTERLEKQGIATIAVGLGGIALSLYELSHGHNPGPILEFGAPADVLLGGFMVALSKVI